MDGSGDPGERHSLLRLRVYEGEPLPAHEGEVGLQYTVLYCTVLYCTVLYSTLLYSTVLYYTELNALPRDALHCTALHCNALHCTALNLTIGRLVNKKFRKQMYLIVVLQVRPRGQGLPGEHDQEHDVPGDDVDQCIEL